MAEELTEMEKEAVRQYRAKHPIQEKQAERRETAPQPQQEQRNSNRNYGASAPQKKQSMVQRAANMFMPRKHSGAAFSGNSGKLNRFFRGSQQRRAPSPQQNNPFFSNFRDFGAPHPLSFGVRIGAGSESDNRAKKRFGFG